MIKAHLRDKSPDYIEGFLWGVDLFAHWKDGVSYVGTGGITRKEVFKCVNKLLDERKATSTNDLPKEKRKFPEEMPEGVWPIIDHSSTGNPDCCGCWIWKFDRTGENYITIICNECGEKRVLLKNENPNDIDPEDKATKANLA